MFGWKKNKEQDTKSTSFGPINSVIGEKMKIAGNLEFKGSARIDGVIEGNVRGESLLLSESGRIKGDVEMQTVISQGRIEGNITARNLTVRKGAVVTGRIAADDLLVELGAHVNGEIKTRVKEKDLRLVQGGGKKEVEAETVPEAVSGA